MIRLTDEEIQRIRVESSNWSEAERIAKAQLEKVVEWGDEPCLEHQFPIPVIVDGIKQTLKSSTYKRRDCSVCWQALLEEVKE